MIIVTKETILKSNVNLAGYYCKNNTCVCTNEYEKLFIEFPDNNGNILLYISFIKTYPYDYIMLGQYINDICKSHDNIEYCAKVTCNNDSQCLSNKCIDNHFRCDYIYSNDKFSDRIRSYMHCGKQYLDSCENNDECSSKICLEQKLCGNPLHFKSCCLSIICC
ncbi:hypothetical protein PIROE2DRAFT_18040 [Piromyces sp. E2]|nr:hypothetical protein PIROE2DRAFT_18040 [Piromyces sp. E2]|eukprot:OUM57076.1 hypothetical protein PIROE2DRAFT_18040 [Piromyces sp. E2]